MTAPSTAHIGRTVFVTVYLLALLLTRAPASATVLLGVLMIAVWAAPLLCERGGVRRPAAGGPAGDELPVVPTIHPGPAELRSAG